MPNLSSEQPTGMFSSFSSNLEPTPRATLNPPLRVDWLRQSQPYTEDLDFRVVINTSPQRNLSARNVLFGMAMSFRASNISVMYRVASEKNGNFVTIDRRFGFLPLVWGKDKRPVAVYEIVEEIEAILDFGKLKSRFPTLSYTQVTATVGFLRSLAQFNSKNVDIDALQDEELENSQSFQDAMRQAVDDKEVVRVLASL